MVELFIPTARLSPVRIVLGSRSLLARCDHPRRWTSRQVKCLADSFQAAVRLDFVQDFGRVIKLDADGNFPITSDLQLPVQYREIVKEVVQYVVIQVGKVNLVAVFLRGSAASGNPLIQNISDLDLILFSRRAVSYSSRQAIRNGISNIAKRLLRVVRVDLRFERPVHMSNGGGRCLMNPSLQIVLRQYSIPIYGSLESVGLKRSPLKPSVSLAMDIRDDERTFLRLLSNGKKNNDIDYQLAAVQWLCKRCLRATAELAYRKISSHARDLVPCYKLGSRAFPEHQDIFLKALQVACAAPHNNFLDSEMHFILTEGTTIAQDFTEVVEQLFLEQLFPEYFSSSSIPMAMAAPKKLLPISNKLNPLNNIRKMSKAISFLFLQPSIEDQFFVHAPPPRIELDVKHSVMEDDLEADNAQRASVSARLLTKMHHPKVLRGVVNIEEGGHITTNILNFLRESMVDCRASPSPEVMFCRSRHEWIESNSFTPPSVARNIPLEEAISRMSQPGRRDPMFYKDSLTEHIYIQTRAPRAQERFCLDDDMKKRITQEERIWISTGGTVSNLHYDASFSALLQICGEKRMVFFPQECNKMMGIYPLGHPLHRRARVNLGRRDTKLFNSFWECCPTKAVEAILGPGDLVLFPPFWCHYTESIAMKRDELSISHTLRYV